MVDDIKIVIEGYYHATLVFGPKSVGTDWSGPIIQQGPDRSVGPSSFWIGLKSVRSKSNHQSVRFDSI